MAIFCGVLIKTGTVATLHVQAAGTYHKNVIINLLLSVLSAIPGNIMSSLGGIVYECVAQVNNVIGNERVMFAWYCTQNNEKSIV